MRVTALSKLDQALPAYGDLNGGVRVEPNYYALAERFARRYAFQPAEAARQVR
jgi:hypothetical protein